MNAIILNIIHNINILRLNQFYGPNRLENQTIAVFVKTKEPKTVQNQLQSPMSEGKTFRFNNNYIIYEL
jgi:hypothetical protein